MTDEAIKVDGGRADADPWLTMLDELSHGSPPLASDGVLDDDAIDRLMGLSTGSDRRTGKEAVADTAAVSNGLSPAMRVVAETFVDTLARRMRQNVAGVIDVTLVDLSLTRLSNGLGRLPLPSLMSVMHSKALGGSGLAVIDGQLAATFFDMLMGGGQAQPREGYSLRPFSSLEIKLFERLAGSVAQAFAEAFSEVSNADFGVERIETNPRFVNLGKATDPAIRLRVQILFGRRGGMLDLLLPVGMFGPVEHLIRQKDEQPSLADDTRWRQHLVRSVARSGIELEVVLTEFRLPLRAVLGMAVGQTIPLDVDSGSIVDLRSNGIRLGSGMMGRSHNHLALRLNGPVIRSNRMRPA